MKKSILLGSLSTLTVGIASIMPITSCSCFNSPESTKTYDFTFNGDNCSINGDKKFTTKVESNKEKVKFTILPDEGYVLPTSPELPEGVTIDNKGVVTIAKMTNAIEFSLTAEVSPIPPGPTPEETFTFTFIGTFCSINNQQTFVEEIPVSKQTVQYTILPVPNYELPKTYPDLPTGVTIDNKGVITITNITTSTVTVNVTAQPVPITNPIINDESVTEREITKTFKKDGTITEFQIIGFTYENMSEDDVKSLIVENSFAISDEDTQISTTIDKSSVGPTSFAVKITITGKSCLPAYSLVSNLLFTKANGEVIFSSYGYKLNLSPYGTISDISVINRTYTAQTASAKVITDKFTVKGFSEELDKNNIWIKWIHTSGTKIINGEGTINMSAGTNLYTMQFPIIIPTSSGTYTENGYMEFCFKPDGGTWGKDEYKILTTYGYTIKVNVQ